jgi:hypothetical protein
MAVPFVSMDLFALATVPTGPDEAKGTATYKLLRATGQPPVLADRPAGMSTRELADEIQRRGLYLKGDGQPASPGQVNARVGNKTYRDRYRKDHLGRICLA